uniref:Uncharacterized protein n=1 Tax=Micrurus carvalhoi TaxID=3147026 RepID=A0A2H6MXT4_9SAUR
MLDLSKSINAIHVSELAGNMLIKDWQWPLILTSLNLHVNRVFKCIFFPKKQIFDHLVISPSPCFSPFLSTAMVKKHLSFIFSSCSECSFIDLPVQKPGFFYYFLFFALGINRKHRELE